MKAIEEEIEYARDKYGAFNSTHELAAVLKEEYDEFWDLVKNNKYPEAEDLLPSLMVRELTQIAAIAIRGIRELENDEIKFV